MKRQYLLLTEDDSYFRDSNLFDSKEEAEEFFKKIDNGDFVILAKGWLENELENEVEE